MNVFSCCGETTGTHVKLCFLCVFMCLLSPAGGTRRSGSRLSSLSFCVRPDYTHPTHCAPNVYRRAHGYSGVIYITSEQSEPSGSFVSHFKRPVSAKPKKKGIFHNINKKRIAPHADFFPSRFSEDLPWRVCRVHKPACLISCRFS